MEIKPILFNTEMSRAILDGRETTTRRAVKRRYSNTEIEMYTNKYGTRLVERQNDTPAPEIYFDENGVKHTRRHLVACLECKSPYSVGDILWVRETWQCISPLSDKEYVYKADTCNNDFITKWLPSIHMPKEAARTFLRVTDVCAERLQEIDKLWENYGKEGMRNPNFQNISIAMQEKFISIWDSTIKKADLQHYGWNANPWVWVIEFERCEKPEGFL